MKRRSLDALGSRIRLSTSLVTGHAPRTTYWVVGVTDCLPRYIYRLIVFYPCNLIRGFHNEMGLRELDLNHIEL